MPSPSRVAPSGLSEKCPGLLGIEGVLRPDALGRIGIRDDRLRPLRYLRVAQQDVVDDRLPVERIEQRLSDTLIEEEFGFLRIEIRHVEAEVCQSDRLQPPIPPLP